MKTRIISALFMLPFVLFLFWGGIPLLAISLAVSLIALYEFYKGFENLNIYADRWMGYVSAICLFAIIVWGEFIQGNEQKVYAHLLCLWAFGTVSAGLIVSIFKKNQPIVDGIIMAIGALYIPFFISHISLITRIPAYSKMVWLVFLSAFGSDIFAYFTGLALGKHKLCPEISPKKTVEGAIGGVLGSSIICGVFGAIFYPDQLLNCIIIGFIGAFFAMGGDLIASVFKRKMGIKDYGNLIPGHGGIMDRFDSVMLTAPFVYYYILIVIRP